MPIRLSSTAPATVASTTTSSDVATAPSNAASTNSSPSASFEIAAADVSARFARASTTKVPDLLIDWQRATVEAAIYEAAANILEPVILKAIANYEMQVGQAMDEKAADAFRSQIHRNNIPSMTPQLRPNFDADDATRQKTIADSLAAYRPEVAKYKDPFTPVAKNDPQARAKEIVLWENARVVVLVDTFAKRPKALVIPKAEVSFPCDMSKRALDELARIAAQVSDAFVAVGGCKDAGIWINAPQDISVKQLHVHVAPDLPKWDKDADPNVVRKQKDALWATLSQELAVKLRHY